MFDERIKGMDYPLRLIIFHGNDEAAALAWRDKLAKNHPDCPIDISYFGPVIGTSRRKSSCARMDGRYLQIMQYEKELGSISAL